MRGSTIVSNGTRNDGAIVAGGGLPPSEDLMHGIADAARTAGHGHDEEHSVSRLVRAIVRAEQLVEQETQMLRAGGRMDLAQFTYRKSQSLLELQRSREQLPIDKVTSDVADRLGRLQRALKTNAELLKAHLEAVQEVSEIISNVIRNDMSDGTYDRSSATAGAGVAGARR